MPRHTLGADPGGPTLAPPSFLAIFRAGLREIRNSAPASWGKGLTLKSAARASATKPDENPVWDAGRGIENTLPYPTASGGTVCLYRSKEKESDRGPRLHPS